MQNLMVFEGHDVEVFELNGQVLFNPYHVGACLELGESAVRMAVAKMNGKQVIKVKKGLSHWQIFFAGRQPCFMPKWHRNRSRFRCHSL